MNQNRTCVRGLNRRELFQTIDLIVRVQAEEITFHQRSRSIGLVWEIETMISRRETTELERQFEKTRRDTQTT